MFCPKRAFHFILVGRCHPAPESTNRSGTNRKTSRKSFRICQFDNPAAAGIISLAS
jgi:hypothetical protein